MRHESLILIVVNENMNKTSIELFNEKAECCNCTACVNICPVNAISIKTDNCGFEFPCIDKEKCLNCGLCQTVCQYKNILKKNKTQVVYASATKNEDLLLSTASGGVFSTIAQNFLNNDGIVYGASMYDNGEIDPKIIRVDKKENLVLLKGSKYVQCDLNDTFLKVKDDLESGKKVLYSGLPCQIAGLKQFLVKDYNNLTTIDIICHGVPSKRMFLDFLKNLGKKRNGRVTEFVFRDKTKGQGQTARFSLECGSKKNTYITNGKLLSYFGLFLKQEIYRESCYKCLHTSCERNSDITLGDYWGIYIEHGTEVNASELTNTKGISCVLINTQNGVDIISSVKKDLILLESTFEKVSRHNNQLREPSKHSKLRDIIFEIYENYGYSAVDNYYNKLIKKKKLFYNIEFFLPKELKRNIKTIMHKIVKQ